MKTLRLSAKNANKMKTLEHHHITQSYHSFTQKTFFNNFFFHFLFTETTFHNDRMNPKNQEKGRGRKAKSEEKTNILNVGGTR